MGGFGPGSCLVAPPAAAAAWNAKYPTSLKLLGVATAADLESRRTISGFETGHIMSYLYFGYRGTERKARIYQER